MQAEKWMWVIFNVVVAGLLFVDLRVFNRHAHVVSIKEAAIWSIVWIGLALLFNVGITFFMGHQKAVEFLTGYVIEKTLSIDNLFIFIMIFKYFNVPPLHQPRILHWGILGALGMRFVLIFAGVALINAFHWVIYVFGALLVYTGAKMVVAGEQKIEPERNPVLRIFKKFMPIDNGYSGEDFFVKKNSIWHATPLFATLLIVEASDLVFAVDSIPAILAITTDSFIVYTSNVFAILGLRALYFALAGVMDKFRFLKVGISTILCYVGVKMLLTAFYKIPPLTSLVVVLTVLGVSVLASVAIKERKNGTPDQG